MIDRKSKRVGNMCRLFRQNKLRMSQKELAYLCGYSKENISAFECGRNDNYRILLLYMEFGLLDYYSIYDLCGQTNRKRWLV